MSQHTISSPVSLSGIGIHSGKRCTVTLNPAPANHGISFSRNGVVIPAMTGNVADTSMSTCLRAHNGAVVRTVEHLMGALYICGIDNVMIDVDNDEIPILDGSGIGWHHIIKSSGLRNQFRARKYIRVINDGVEVSEGASTVKLLPYDGIKYTAMIDFTHPAIGIQEFCTDSEGSFGEILKSRTFGFLSDLERLTKMGLAKGANDTNCIIMDEYNIINTELRTDNEFVKHKILDAIGDLFLLGYRFIGEYRGVAAGHRMNNEICVRLLESHNYEIIEEGASDGQISEGSGWNFLGGALHHGHQY